MLNFLMINKMTTHEGLCKLCCIKFEDFSVRMSCYIEYIQVAHFHLKGLQMFYATLPTPWLWKGCWKTANEEKTCAHTAISDNTPSIGNSEWLTSEEKVLFVRALSGPLVWPQTAKWLFQHQIGTDAKF